VARRNGFSPRRRSGAGVARDWGFGTGGTGLTTIDSSSSAILGAGVQTTGSELTLLRTRGIVDLFLRGGVNAPGDGFFGAVGIAIASDQAFTAGVASLPTPLSEASANVWLWHQYLSVHGEATDVGEASSNQRIEIDSKAMRKFDANQVMYCCIEVVEIGTAELNVFMDSRILFQDSGR